MILRFIFMSLQKLLDIMNILQNALLIVFHPLDCMDIIKRQKKKPLWIVVLLYALAVVVNYSYVYIVHFPLGVKKIEDVSILLDLAMVVVPMLSWVIASYAITAIMSGESHFKDSLLLSAYTLVPYIVLTPILGLVSNILGITDKGPYEFIRSSSVLWIVILLIVALKHMNDYSFRKTIGVTCLSIVAMLVMWATCLLTFSLTVQFFYFFTGLFQEINLKYFI